MGCVVGVDEMNFVVCGCVDVLLLCCGDGGGLFVVVGVDDI